MLFHTRNQEKSNQGGEPPCKSAAEVPGHHEVIGLGFGLFLRVSQSAASSQEDSSIGVSLRHRDQQVS